MNITKKELKKQVTSSENIKAVETYLKAKAFAECEKERVDGYLQPLINEYKTKFNYVGMFEGEKDIDPNDIKTIADVWVLNECNDSLVNEVYEKAEDLHELNGFTGERGYSPALIAESLESDAKRAVVDMWFDFLGVDGTPTLLMSRRNEMLDIAVKSTVQANQKYFKNLSV